MCASLINEKQIKSRKPELLYKFDKFESDINFGYIFPNEDAIVILAEDRSVRIYIKRDSGGFWPAVYQHLPSAGVTLQYCDKSKRLFIGCDNGTIMEYSLRDDFNAIVHKRDYLAHVSRITGMVLCDKYNWILTCGKDKLFTFYSTQSGLCINGFQLQSPCTCIKFDEEAKYVFVGDIQGKILLLDIRKCSESDSLSNKQGPELVKSLNGHSNQPIRSLDWDYSTKKLISSGDDNLVIVWNFGGNKGEALELMGHCKPVTSVLSLEALSGKNKESMIISTSLDGLVLFWIMSVDRKQTPEWSNANNCEVCSAPYFWNFKKIWEDRKLGVRQHHCRKCGKAVCNTCSPNLSKYPPMGFEIDVRMCSDCKDTIKESDLVPLTNSFDSKHAIVSMNFDYKRKLMLTIGADRFIKLWNVKTLLT